MFRRLSVTCLLSCVLVSSAFAAIESSKIDVASDKKTDAEYWAEVGLSYSLIEDTVTESGCYRSEPEFLGCVHALNAALASGKKDWLIVTRAQTASGQQPGAVQSDFGPAMVVTAKPATDGTLFEIYRTAKLERQSDRQAWLQVFRDRRDRVPFGKMAAWVRALIPTAKESEATANAYNMYLNTTKDPHTRIASKAAEDDSRSQSSESFSGIGVQIQMLKKVLVVVAPLEGGPAVAAGVRANDIITAVDGKSIENVPMDDTIRLIRGPQGTVVTITVKRGSRTLDLTITRASIVTKNVDTKVVSTETGNALGYVKLTDFGRNSSCSDTATGVEGLVNRGVKGLIFDLRGNPGGLVNVAACIANLFLDKGKAIYSMISLPGFSGDYTSTTESDAFTSLPMVTLINGSSASASELVSGALQDHQRSFIVGTRSFGKGTKQTGSVWSKNRKVMYYETDAYFVLPTKRSNQLTGVIPDFREVYKNPSPTEEDKFALREEDIYLNALPPPGVNVTFRQSRPGVVAKLQSCVDNQGTAKAQFAAHENDAIPADYQLYSAEDTLQCALGSARNGAPLP